MLKDHNINRLPIVNDDGTIAGIVSRGDIVHSFCARIL
jgi:CBS domain-containing protein